MERNKLLCLVFLSPLVFLYFNIVLILPKINYDYLMAYLSSMVSISEFVEFKNNYFTLFCKEDFGMA